MHELSFMETARELEYSHLALLEIHLLEQLFLILGKVLIIHSEFILYASCKLTH